MFKRLSTFTLATLITASCSHQTGMRFPASSGSTIEDWNQALYLQHGTLPKVSVDELYAIFKSSQNAQVFIDQLEQLGLANKYSDKADYLTLVDKLFAVKKKIRLSDAKTAKGRNASYYLTLMAEDVLQALKINFGVKVFTKGFNNDTSDCGNRFGFIRETAVCQGDIVVSKGIAGSATFLARFMKDPGHFSHSTIAWIDSKRGVHMAEAEIEDGVKLRSAKSYYDGLVGVKYYTFRYRGKTKADQALHRGQSIIAMDNFVNKMKSRVADVATQASFAYDFTMDPNETNKALFCSEIPYAVYKDSAMPETKKPYPKSVWSKTSAKGEDFTQKVIGIQDKTLPVPSDIEENPNYDMVTIFYNLENLKNERYDVAMVDAFLSFIRSGHPKAKEFYNWVEKMPNVKTEKIAVYLKKSGYLKPEQFDAIAKQIPENIGIKQFVFFAVMNQKVTPLMREQLGKADSDYQKANGYPMGREKLEEVAGQLFGGML